ncbi:plakophilin-2-like isoform X2 [Hypanus sabinus]|uniref:plakophilin-2-like isoform X2 n=1 Tax=Hypanus sabinus TaxID=79690 RepID=UPI0028C3DADE|nr:plakophilin-2-like isoform X2 [Hypanus sabinus]
MDASTGGFIRTALARPTPGSDSSLAVPPDERIQAADRSHRLRQQLRLALARRETATGGPQQALLSPGPVYHKTPSTFDCFTIPLPGSSYNSSKHQQSVRYGAKPGQTRQALQFSSETRRFQSQGLQSHATKPSYRIEVAVDDSPVVVRNWLRRGPSYRSERPSERIRAVSCRQRGSAGWAGNARFSSWHSSRYPQSETFSFRIPPLIRRSLSQPAQWQVRPVPEEPSSPDSVFLHDFPMDCIVQQHSRVFQTKSSTVRRHQSSSLGQQLQGVSLSNGEDSQSRPEPVVCRYNWNQESVQTSNATADTGAVTQGLVLPEASPLQAQSISSTLASREDHETQEAQPSASARSLSQPAQWQVRPVPEEPSSPDSVFLHDFPMDCIVGQHSRVFQTKSSTVRRHQSSSLGQQLQGVSLSNGEDSQSRLEPVVCRYNWNQESVQTSNATADAGAVTQGLVLPEASPLQAQSISSTLASREDHESQEAQPSASASVSVDDNGEWTMETAVSALTQEKMDYVVYGANFIQHECFQRPEAKKELYELDGIEKLVALLSSEDVEVQRAACAAIRNGVFEENNSKIEVKKHDGLQKLVELLGQSKDIETKKQVTGLMWNLSSSEELKNELIKKALHPLTTTIIIPYAGWPDGDVKVIDMDPDIFYNTTGCLRNLSSSSPEGRKQMRECEGLIDSLVLYIQSTIANNQEDDKSTENSTCVLHNLAFQLEHELPSAYVESLGWRNDSSAQQKSAGCFGARSNKLKEERMVSSACIEEKRNPQGVEWLWHSLVVRMYLSLIARSSHTCTQEASLGALQNLTANSGVMGYTITEIITTKENGIQHLRRTLHSKDLGVQKATISLLRNMARNPRVHDQLEDSIEASSLTLGC